MYTGGSPPVFWSIMKLFLDNKYTKYYFSIIKNRKQNPIDESMYFEKHHIVPKCFGGRDDETNIVKLSAREHFICHRLLVKLTVGKEKSKMSWALWRLANPRKFVNVSSRQYEQARKTFKENVGLLTSYPRSEETKEKMRGKRPHVNQTGKNNNNFAGFYYKTPWGIFDSSSTAQKECPFEIPVSSLISMCKSGDKVVKKTNKYNLQKGKTYRELGYDLVEA